MNLRLATTLMGIAGLFTGFGGYAQEAGRQLSAEDALLNGTAHLNLRYRYEYVDQSGFPEKAHASTLLMRLNYQSGIWRDWSAFTEFDYVGELLVNDFTSGAGTSSLERSQFPVVADPKGSDLNQLYVDYGGIRDTKLRFGRQRIVLDDQRFVGGVAWRQNEQTYDGVSALWKGASNIEVFYAYIANINRIFGERTVAGDHDGDVHLLHGTVPLSKQWELSPYVYSIDNNDLAVFSTLTYGVRAAGKVLLEDGAIALTMEIASQSDAGNNPVNYSAEFYRLHAAWQLKNQLEFAVGIESLGGDQLAAGQSFRTPLATLHKFQGWADQFLTTPNAGIEDVYLTAKGKYTAWVLQATYHDFSAQDGGSDWGTELDFSASRALGERYTLLLKAATFNPADTTFSDTTKLWLQVGARF